MRKSKNKKKVIIKQNQLEDDGISTAAFSMRDGEDYSLGSVGTYANDMAYLLDVRKLLKAFDDDGQQVTPKLFEADHLSKPFKRLRARLRGDELMRRSSSSYNDASKILTQSRMGFRLSIDDIINGIDADVINAKEPKTLDSQGSSLSMISVGTESKLRAPFRKVILQRSNDILLYEQQSTTALRHTKEGKAVEENNRAYEYITVGKGKLRRRSEAEAQTNDVLYKSRDINTDRLFTTGIGTYVSNFEMYDTLTALDHSQSILHLVGDEDAEAGKVHKDVVLTTYKRWRAIDDAIAIMQSPRFKLASMLMKRFLAGNNYCESQRRYRCMNMPSPLDMNHVIRYNVRFLFRYDPQSKNMERKAVTDISWCNKNRDILAAGYGIYSFSSMHVPSSGYVCVWSIKNPDDPERCYYFNEPVVSVAFSPSMPALLAVGLYDGTVEVFDITNANDPSIAVSQRSMSLSCEPISKIKWIGNTVDESADIEPFLALSQNGSVTKLRIINSPFLLGFLQMMLERVEGQIDGLQIKNVNNIGTQANRHPQGLNLTLHPLQTDVYYVSTDEGCIHKCSTNYPHQHLEAQQTHGASVNNMDFAPWSPSIFLTSGNDWTVRVWMDGVFKPLLTLKSQSGPVHCAFWSRTHSTVLLALNRKTIDIWDIRRNTLNPVSSNNIDSSYHTMCKISKNGQNIAIGNERGCILICAFEDFPFPPHFQFDELENALRQGVSTDKELLHEVLAKGLQSYPNKKARFSAS